MTRVYRRHVIQKIFEKVKSEKEGIHLICTLVKKLFKRKENICRFFTERKYISGITVIELVLILVIVIALLLIFKTELINLINSIFDKITSEVQAFN